MERGMTQRAKKSIISIPEVKELLEKLPLESTDQIQKRTLEYTTKFSRISVEDARKIKNKLVEQCELTEEEAVELVNVMPKTNEELRTFASGWKKLIRADISSQILQILGSQPKKE